MFEGKTVIITGASRGIGRAVALNFAQLKANVVINYNSNEPVNLYGEFDRYNYSYTSVKADISIAGDAERLVSHAKQHFGSVDILINNAGITKDSLIMRMPEKDFCDVININLKGTFNTIKYASSIMLKQRSGVIINISSVSGLTGNAGQANYAASKAGVIGLTKSVARELASRNIRCNAIAPGFIDTSMTSPLSSNIKDSLLKSIPLNRFGTVDDVANACIFLAQNNYITGQVISIDGGMYM
ncbi:MAG: 3-oxoacyl-[acyl-carrier-protein] reductase [Clostridiales bacterium]|nr:3-oxoacyl-[acyl-carrier-protein] reductase [Clostridiales bacterium]